MSSLHHVMPAAHHSTSAAASAGTAPAHQFSYQPITVPRLLLQARARLTSAWQLVCLWNQRRRDRAVLRSLGLRQIRDFCPRESEAEEEMNKPFWRA